MRTLLFVAMLGLSAGLNVRSLCAAETGDMIVLNDGRKVEGKIVREDENAIFLKVENGEERGISKLRIKEIYRNGARPGGANVVPAAEPKAAEALPEPKAPGMDLNEETRAIYDQLTDLGHSSKDKRKAAIERTKALGFKAMPVLQAIFHPGNKSTPDLRIGALRAMVELAPLDQTGAEVLGYVAMKDPDYEVRREACQAIRAMKDDRAINYILQFAIREDKQIQFPAARALRELNDDRVFATLAQIIPPVEVQNPNPDQKGRVREMNLPTGPLGASMPIYLPESSVAGTVTNIDSPPATALKIISGKELGNFQTVWINWVQEKIGAYTQKDREEAYRKRSMRDKMGSPHGNAP